MREPSWSFKLKFQACTAAPPEQSEFQVGVSICSFKFLARTIAQKAAPCSGQSEFQVEVSS